MSDTVSDLLAWQYRALTAELLCLQQQLARLQTAAQDQQRQIEALLAEMRTSVEAMPADVYDAQTKTFRPARKPALVTGTE